MTRPISLRIFIDKVTVLYSTGKHAGSTLGRVEQVGRELRILLGTRATTADLNTENMARFVASRGATANPNTTNGLLSTIAALCTYAVEEGWLEKSPAWRRVRLRPAKMVLNRPPPYEEVSKLLVHVRSRRGEGWQASRLSGLLWTVALTGCRLGEALHAHWEDLSDNGLVIDPRRHRLKSERSARTVPVPDALTELLEERRRTADAKWIHPGVRRIGPWTGGTALSRPLGQLRTAAADAGIGRVTWHSLRHSFGTTAVREGIPLWVVSNVMGHSDLRTTQRYLHLDGSPEIQEALRGFSYGHSAAGA